MPMASALKLSWHLGKFLIISKMQNQSSGGGVPDKEENTCVMVSFLIKLQAKSCKFIKKQTLAQLFSSEFCETF